MIPLEYHWMSKIDGLSPRYPYSSWKQLPYRFTQYSSSYLSSLQRWTCCSSSEIYCYSLVIIFKTCWNIYLPKVCLCSCSFESCLVLSLWKLFLWLSQRPSLEKSWVKYYEYPLLWMTFVQRKDALPSWQNYKDDQFRAPSESICQFCLLF